jgi:hypothetical protein
MSRERNILLSFLPLRFWLNFSHQENVIYYGTLQTTTEHYVVLCSKIQPTDGVTKYGARSCRVCRCIYRLEDQKKVYNN